MNIKKRWMLSWAAIGFTSLAFLANAQEHHSHPSKEQTTQQQECHNAKMAKSKAERAAAWHDELKITPVQEASWKAFIDSFPQPGARHAEQKKLSHASTASLSAPEHLEKRLVKMEKHLAAMQVHLAKLKALYTQLTPEQQILLNQRLAQFEHKHPRHHGRHKHHQSSDHIPSREEKH